MPKHNCLKTLRLLRVSLGGAYSLLGTIDINGDGTDEAIVERADYEGTSFEIYEYKMVNSIAFSAVKGAVVEVVFQ